ncbi:MAG TPA: asparaginase domain-containing protein [Vicinamibacterales bacterium]|nr:asparaginase domain-containing protein [Vicinamibacterales bacterium]
MANAAEATLQHHLGVASDPRARGRGVLVVANDDIHGARAITKRHTTDVETFVSPEVGLIGVCLFEDREFSRTPLRAHTTATPFKVTAGQTLPRVDIICAHAGMWPDLIDAAVAGGANGLVIAGVGDGNMTTPALEAVRRAIAKGTVIVRSTRVGEGIVRRNIEVDDDKTGTVVSKELNPAKSRVLLKLALTQSSEPKQVQALFDKY